MRQKTGLLSLLLAFLLLAGFSAFVVSCADSKDDSSPGTTTGTDFGNRIPKDYFVTSGKGQTDIGPGDDPWETGSYDLALMDARIENFNVTQYSSVLPPESNEIPIDDAVGTFHHGAVIETIMASVNGVKGNTLATGVGRIQVKRKSDGRHIGGFAAEYEKVHLEEIALADAEKAANDLLHISLMGEVNRRYSSDEYEFFDEKHEVSAFKIEKNYGTSLVALGWVSYIYPEEPAVQE